MDVGDESVLMDTESQSCEGTTGQIEKCDQQSFLQGKWHPNHTGLHDERD